MFIIVLGFFFLSYLHVYWAPYALDILFEKKSNWEAPAQHLASHVLFNVQHFSVLFAAYSESLGDKRIVLLEAASDKGDFSLPEQYSVRTCALSPATVKLLSSKLSTFFL